MSRKYNQNAVTSSVSRFTSAPMSQVEFSRMTASPEWQLPFNAGDIVPVYYAEVLPHDTFDISLNFVIRQMTALHPTMGQMQVDFYAYFVPNRIINESWRNVMGENTSGFWTAPEVSLAPLYTGLISVKVPVGSIADYYGFPTQLSIDSSVLRQCNDLKFRGYLEIYNNYFRDENYQNPIPYSKLNVYNGFMLSRRSGLNLLGNGNPTSIPHDSPADGSFGSGALVKALFGEGGSNNDSFNVPTTLTSFSALDKPLKANKLHDFITSGLPSPQKGQEVYFGVGDIANLSTGEEFYDLRNVKFSTPGTFGNSEPVTKYLGLALNEASAKSGILKGMSENTELTGGYSISGTNVFVDLSTATGISVNDLRTAIATQQVYETLARGGSRYTEMIASFFGIQTENPFSDKPTELGHIRRELDLFQVAQTSASQQGETPQGELTAFGYTSTGGHMFTRTFLEHGYIHIFAVVRQRNIYSTFFAPDNFRLNTMDFYLPQLANIGEQPIRKAVLNPFRDDSMEKVLAYQEAWWEYRYEPDRVHGLFRTVPEENPDGTIPQTLSMWNYADEFDGDFDVVTGDWLKSNAEEVLNRTIAVTSEQAPQFKGSFRWKITKQRPMPTYSVPGLDMI